MQIGDTITYFKNRVALRRGKILNILYSCVVVETDGKKYYVSTNDIVFFKSEARNESN